MIIVARASRIQNNILIIGNELLTNCVQTKIAFPLMFYHSNERPTMRINAFNVVQRVCCETYVPKFPLQFRNLQTNLSFGKCKLEIAHFLKTRSIYQSFFELFKLNFP